MTVAAIDVRSLRVERGGSVVIPDLTVSIEAGHVTGLLGPSGSGKTTLLRSIVGVQEVASGSVTVLGAPAGSAPLRRRVGYVTQAPSLYSDLSVRENLRYFARVLGVDRSEVDRVVGVVDLGHRVDAVVTTLSGGEAARASLAVAMLGSPDLLVLDEPTVGLDPILRRDLWATFTELAARGVTLLVSSHVMDEADRCDRLVLMREGRLLSDSTLPELLAATGTSSVEAAFLKLVAATGDAVAGDESAS